ncbi:DUF4411 family protein [Clavibacter sp. Sh2126]|uniref:DUF4411 family protein n=1 Tax=Clavibacter sp. Sh2126 TaxID=3397678 RepID=UPI0039E0E456
MKYLLDANIFIQSHRAHYGLDFVPAFWDWLDQEFLCSRLMSITAVRDELMAGEDDLAAWAAERPRLFEDMDLNSLVSLRAVAAWTMEADYTDPARRTFLDVADCSLVAFAHAHDLTVVTMERSEPARRSKIKIPDACRAMQVECITPFTMLRSESARFVLRT